MQQNEARRFRVMVTDFVHDDLTPEREVLENCATVEGLDAYHEGELVGRVEHADALIVFHQISLSRRTIDRLDQCKVIARCGVGVDNVDIGAARQRGIPVVNVPDYGTEEVADSAIGLTLSLTRGIAALNSRLRDPAVRWTYEHAVPRYRLRGRVFGVVGLGRIGTATALRAKALGMDVVFYDPFLPDGYDKAVGVRRADSLEQLCRQTYVLSLHCPLTDQTRLMINTQSLSWLPRGAYLVNTARGAIVDTAVIPDFLASGHLAGAALDVLPAEPPQAGDPLLAAWRDPRHPAYERLILNPHAAFYCEEGRAEMRRKAALACRHAILGLPLRNVVN